MGTAEPNDGHHLLAALEARGAVDFLVTQNVDGLHERAGQRRMTALHGRIAEVVCLDCRAVSGRHAVQARMIAANPGYLDQHAAAPARPDGDVDLDATGGFVVPTCDGCGGRLKPHVVFFGENVPKDRVLRAQAEVDAADALVVLGSSLTVMSGLRFVRQAARNGTPVLIVNRGTTRGDELATYRLDARCADFLRSWHDRTEVAAAVTA
jgi:NAD-dependent SIR2 family protein deacetylase